MLRGCWCWEESDFELHFPGKQKESAVGLHCTVPGQAQQQSQKELSIASLFESWKRVAGPGWLPVVLQGGCLESVYIEAVVRVVTVRYGPCTEPLIGQGGGLAYWASLKAAGKKLKR